MNFCHFLCLIAPTSIKQNKQQQRTICLMGGGGGERRTCAWYILGISNKKKKKYVTVQTKYLYQTEQFRIREKMLIFLFILSLILKLVINGTR